MEKISDERLEQIQTRHRYFDEVGCRPNDGIYGFLEYEEEASVIDELLSARQTIADQSKMIGELKENSKRLVGMLTDAIRNHHIMGVEFDMYQQNIEKHIALLKKMEVMG